MYSGWSFLNKNLYSFLFLTFVFLIEKSAINFQPFAPQGFRPSLSVAETCTMCLMSEDMQACHLFLKVLTSAILTQACHYSPFVVVMGWQLAATSPCFPVPPLLSLRSEALPPPEASNKPGKKCILFLNYTDCNIC